MSTQIADPWENRQPQYLAGLIICLIILPTVISLRLYAQSTIHQLNQPDNWLILVSLLFSSATVISSIVAIHFGVGKHVVRVLAEDPNPPNHLIHFQQAGYAFSIVTSPSMMFTRLSIIFFYYRVFTAQKRLFRYAIIFLGIWVTLRGIGATFAYIFQCTPISLFWNEGYKVAHMTAPFPLHGHCTPSQLRTGTITIAGAMGDIGILCLPPIGLWGLQMNRVKKFAILITLTLGVFAVGIDAIRIYYCFRIDNTGDPTWENAGVFVWTGVLDTVATVCACIPTTAPLLKRFRENRKKKSNYYKNYDPNQSHSLRNTKTSKFKVQPRNVFQSQSGDDASTKGLKNDLINSHTYHATRWMEDAGYEVTARHGSSDADEAMDSALGQNIHVEKGVSVTHE